MHGTVLPHLQEVPMNSSPIDVVTLTARVKKLESANRCWKLANAVLLLFGVSLVLMGAKPADRIEPDVLHVRSVDAQEFVLKGEDGHVYARLSLNLGAKQASGRSYLMPSQPISGQASLQFYDDKGDVLWIAPSRAQFIPAR
jgi:hypothetical protein